MAAVRTSRINDGRLAGLGPPPGSSSGGSRLTDEEGVNTNHQVKNENENDC
jgi:hypothetical protein